MSGREPVNIVKEPPEAPEPNTGIEQGSFSPDGKNDSLYYCKKYSGKEYALNTNTE
ncbi:MAG: hypothetical protein IPI30_18830 [Saprospiraceae bacterium]|nr:hypothetical protein [Candidatus Vicinibacter affinis]